MLPRSRDGNAARLDLPEAWAGGAVLPSRMLSKRASSGRFLGLAAALFTLTALGCAASPPPPPPAQAVAGPSDAVLITIFLRHDQTKSLDEIQAHLQRTSFWREFPPAGIEVVDWYVMMGIGQVIILRVPPSRLREVNLAVERRAWGAFRSEFYPTYDYRAIAAEQRSKAGAAPLPEKGTQGEPSAPASGPAKAPAAPVENENPAAEKR